MAHQSSQQDSKSDIFDILSDIIHNRFRPDIASLRIAKTLEDIGQKDSPLWRLLVHRSIPIHQYILKTTEEIDADKMAGEKYIPMNFYSVYKHVKRCELSEALSNGIEIPNNLEHESYMSTKMPAGPRIDAFLTDERVKNMRKVFASANLSFSVPTNSFELISCIETIRSILHAGQPTKYTELKRKHRVQVTRELKSYWSETYNETITQEEPRKGKHSQFTRDSANTYTAQYQRRNDSFRKKNLPKALQPWNAYTDALNILGILEGRLRNYFASNIRSECARLDKSGLITFGLITKDILEKDLNTAIWLAMAVSEFSVRKEFTLESQQQGALNEHLKWIYDELLSKSGTTQWDLIALVYPIQSVLEKCSLNHLQKMKKMWTERLTAMAIFLRDQFAKGVDKSAARGEYDLPIRWGDATIKTMTCMMVPKQGSGVDSVGWNDVSGAWNNAIRHLRSIARILGEEPLPLFKCMKLTAGDQMQWAASEYQSNEILMKELDDKLKTIQETQTSESELQEIEMIQMQLAETDRYLTRMKKNKNDMYVFHDIIEKGVLPWSALDGKIDQNTIIRTVEEICAKYDVPIGGWLGIAQERTTETKDAHDMICGCVADVPKYIADILKYNGVFGSSPALVKKNIQDDDLDLDKN